jgi:hypothetical protein
MWQITQRQSLYEQELKYKIPRLKKMETIMLITMIITAASGAGID